MFKEDYKKGLIEYDQIMNSIQGWFAYAMWADTYKLRKMILININKLFSFKFPKTNLTFSLSYSF